MKTYKDFLEEKRIIDHPTGMKINKFNPALFEFQKDIVRWALDRGRAAIFADCGMGKTLMQLEWAKNIPGDGQFMVLLAYATFTKRRELKHQGILDQLYAIAAGWA